MSKSYTLRDVPEDLHDRVKRAAALATARGTPRTYADLAVRGLALAVEEIERLFGPIETTKES